MNIAARVRSFASVATLLCALPSLAQRPFTIYGYVVYPAVTSSGAKMSYLAEYAAPTYGINAINLVYEDRLLDVNKTHPNDAKINTGKISSVAKDSPANRLVALDMESWKRFDKEHTPALYEQVLTEFHKRNPNAKVGLYAVVPQVTYGWRPDLATKYDPLNASYAGVAALVDYFSPSLYNWDHALDNDEWARAAKFGIESAKHFDPRKPVLPYVTPEVARDGKVSFLSYDQMLFRLRTLRELGADGCIVWTGTAGGRRDGGLFDPLNGWGKAVVDFAKEAAATRP